jgi:serine/threonine-protein kinase
VPLKFEHVQASLSGQFEIEALIGRGGMSLVYAARAPGSNVPIAVKVLRPEYAATILSERFKQEIEVLAELDHPNILPLLASGIRGSYVYYVMPHADGGTLEERLREDGHLSLDETVRITSEVAAGIDYAHGHNVIHRDIKPGNIMRHRGRWMICDFGVAKAIVSADTRSISSSGLVVGTPHYMSPEQAEGSKRVGPACDIYSLGCVAFEMLAGEPPFTGSSPQIIIARHAHETPPSVRVVRPDLPEHVDRALQCALAKRPRKRCPTAHLFAAMLAGTAH